MDPEKKFAEEVQNNIESLRDAKDFHNLSLEWLKESGLQKWSYNFRWMGRPAIQIPNDAWAMQELLWQVKPDLVIECGIAHGGSLIYYASLLAMLDLSEAIHKKEALNYNNPVRKVLGVDIDIRTHNRAAIEDHAMYKWIDMIEGSSVDDGIIKQVQSVAKNFNNILVVLDSNHTHEHVLQELEAYAPLVTKNSYCVVFDTIVEDMPAQVSSGRPWGPGNSPKTAVWEYLKKSPDFVIDKDIHHKLQITVGPDGFLKRVQCLSQ